jgi:hypothetical protein
MTVNLTKLLPKEIAENVISNFMATECETTNHGIHYLDMLCVM